MVILRLDDAVIKSLSDSELSILRFVYEHIQEVLDMSIHEVSKQVSYSSTTILRFCKKLGFSGFAEFKYALRAEVKQEAQPSVRKSDLFTTEMIMRQLCADVEGSARLIQQDQLHQLFHYFDSGCAIYLWSPGGITSILIDYFEKLLFSIGRGNVYKIESSKMSEHIIRSLTKDSFMIAISTTGNFSPTARLVKLARMNDIPVMTITPYANNEIANMATLNFRFFTNQRENNGAEYTSRLPVFYLIQMIIRSYLYYCQEKEESHASID